MYWPLILAVLFLIATPLLIARWVKKDLFYNPWYDAIFTVVALVLFALFFMQSNSESGNMFETVMAYLWLLNAILHGICIPLDIKMKKLGW